MARVDFLNQDESFISESYISQLFSITLEVLQMWGVDGLPVFGICDRWRTGVQGNS